MFKIGLQESESARSSRFHWLPGLYRMSKNGVYPSSVPSCITKAFSISKRPVPNPILVVDRPLYYSNGSMCGPSVNKLVYRNTDLYEFRGYIGCQVFIG